MDSLEQRRVVVMGLGRFGGGVGVTRWLAAQGADVLVTDRENAERLGESVRAIRDLVDSGVVQLRLGEHRVSDFTTADLVVVNPAVPQPWDDRFVRSAQAAGVEIRTEIGLVCSMLDRGRVIGVTGSAGKSTVCSMIHGGMRAAGISCVLGGNIGGSLLNRVSEIRQESCIVLELSSAMLYWLGLDGWSPGTAVVTNLEPNHLDWHGSESHYAQSKRRILMGQAAGDMAVLGSGVGGWETNSGVGRVVVGEDAAVDGCDLPGRHNAWNGAIALAACMAAAPDRAEERLLEGIRRFPGLPHRLCLVYETAGVRYYDDSKSTVPRATVLAVHAIRERLGPGRVHLICGGYDKGASLGEIAALGGELGGIYAIGSTGQAIVEAAQGHALWCKTLDIAVERAAGRAAPGDAVLLSPGCASWDQFDHFEARGNAFAAFARGVGMRGEIP
ncbi:MAG: Mur ligase family protein [Planctomycetota bacterium]